MLAGLRRSLLSSGFVLLTACGAWAQTATLQGDVKDASGQPLKGALITLDRTDIKGHYKVKSDKKGHWLYTGLPGASTFDISCEVDGKLVDKATNVKASYGDNPPVDFDLAKVQKTQAATQQANANGQVSQEQARGMSKEQKEQYEAQLKKNSEAIKKNKALNDLFNAGQDSLKMGGADTDPAKKTTDYQAAVDKFNQAGQMDANQPAIWDGLGQAYEGLGKAQTGDEKNKSFDQAIQAYQKGLAIKPNDPAVYNQMGNIYALEKKMPEATDALTKAAQLDPQMAPKAYYNMGANMVNSGQPEKASDFFKKATDADPNYADAWYQYGSLLMMQGKVDPKSGKQDYPPDTSIALKKYLDLQPSGPHAQEATAMLQALGETVQTKITAPGAKKKKP